MAAFKLFLGLFAFSTALLVPFSSAAQQKAVENQQLSVVKALEKVGQQEGLNFSFERGPLENLIVSIEESASWFSLRQALTELGIQVERTDENAYLLVRNQARSKPELQVYSLQLLGGGEPLAGATAQANDGRNWVSDKNGQITIARQETPLLLDINYLGFQGQRIFPRPEQALHDVRELQPDTLLAAMAYVICSLPNHRSEKSLTVSNAVKSPYGGLSIGKRSIQQLGFSAIAGASYLEGGSARPRLRGSLGAETLIQLDGKPLYHVDHFFGLFNAVNPLVIDDITLYRSHYPADRGGYRGGMMEIETIKPKKTGVQLDVNQVFGSAGAQVKGKDISILLGGRTTLQDLAQTSAFDSQSGLQDQPQGISGATSPNFRFNDYYGKLTWHPSSSLWELEISAFRSMDAYELLVVQNDAIAFQRGGRLSFTYDEQNRWTNGSFGASLKRKTRQHLLELNAYQSNYQRLLESSSTGNFLGNFGEREADITQSSLDNDITDQQVEFRISPNKKGQHSWMAGAQLQQLSTLALFQTNNRIPVDLDRISNRAHLFGFHQNPLWENSTLSVGLRISHAFDLDETWASPRLKLEHRWRDYRIDLGYSYTRQAIRTLDQENPFGQRYSFYIPETNEQGGAATAQNFTLGIKRELASARIHAEAYYRHLPGTLANLSSVLGVSQTSSIFTPQPLFTALNGLGQVVGIDVDLGYSKGIWEGQLAYTLSSSTQRFRQIANNAWLRAPDDRRHRLATSHTFCWKAFSFTGNYEAASGFQFTDLSLLSEQENRSNANPEDYQNTLPAYHRFDLSGSWKHKLKRNTFELGVSVYNLLDRANVAYRQYIVFSEAQNSTRGVVPVGTDVSLLRRLLLVEIGYSF